MMRHGCADLDGGLVKILRSMCLFLFLLGFAESRSQEHSTGEPRELTGNLHVDLSVGTSDKPSLHSFSDLPAPERKSPFLAAALSVAVPGAGELYAEKYWRAASFFGAEVILWVIYASRTAKGDDQTAAFQQYADDHWSVVRYANWMETNASILNPSSPPCSGIVTNPDPQAAPWDRVDWGVLNECEANIGAKASTGFSHRLPRRPDQQYYELIGKYLQYNAGWDDWGSSGPSTTEYLVSPSARFREYRDMRGRANDYYNIATTASFLLVANHILSGLDAAWGASQHNAEIKVRAHLQPMLRETGFVEFVPTAKVMVSF